MANTDFATQDILKKSGSLTFIVPDNREGQRLDHYLVEMLPAVGQGAVGIELREADQDLLNGLSFLQDDATSVAVTAERGFLTRLEGGCQVPIGAFAEVSGAQFTLTGLVASVNGETMVKREVTGDSADAETIGRQLAEEILGLGGKEILEEVYGSEIS